MDCEEELLQYDYKQIPNLSSSQLRRGEEFIIPNVSQIEDMTKINAQIKTREIGLNGLHSINARSDRKQNL